jgi:hypothetical protein
MKIKFLIGILALILGATSVFAQSNRSGRNDRMRDRENTEMTEVTTTQPCMRYDDDEYYAASGSLRIKMGGNVAPDAQQAVMATKLLGLLRQQVKQKIGGKYQAVVRDYFDQMDINETSSVASHIESAGEQVIDQYLNDTEEDCRQLGEMDEETGYANLYMGILVKKTALVDNLVDGIMANDQVPQDAKAQLRANEAAFRESAFKQFEIQE